MHNERPEIEHPWGGYTILKKTNSYWAKKLFVHKNARLSLQSHQYRSEIWFVLSGTIMAQVSNKEQEAQKGALVFIPKKAKHRITGLTDACVLEIAFGRVLERDIVRYEDDYGRVSK
jgi:mannose-6-phosphate isomerase